MARVREGPFVSPKIYLTNFRTATGTFHRILPKRFHVPVVSEPFGKVAARLAGTIDRQREYTVIRNDNIFRSGFIDRHIFSSDYQRAIELLRHLLDLHQGAGLGEVFGGQAEEGALGGTWIVRSSEPAPSSAPSPRAALERLHQDLRLVRGIGPALETRLRRRGYGVIGELCWNRRFGPAARDVFEVLEEGSPTDIARICIERHGPSHPGVFLATELYSEADHLYLDLETLGLFSRPVVLFGLAWLRAGHVEVEQHLVTDLAFECGALDAALREIEDRSLLISFNGRSFDLPYLVERAAFYGLPAPRPTHHLDLLPLARRCWRDRLPNCRLGTIESCVLGHVREDDLPSAMVPEFYAAFQRSGNPGPLLPILRHNREDLVSMVRIVAALREVCHAA